MKKIILYLIIILASQIIYKITPVLVAQQYGVDLEIEKALNEFYSKNLETIMKCISPNFSGKTDNGTVVDYAKFKDMTEKRLHNFSKKYIDYSNEINILKLDIQGNDVTVEYEVSWKGFNLDTIHEESGKKRRVVALTKENGSWKITRWMPLK